MTPATNPETVPSQTDLPVDATGTRRRVQALVAFGWPLSFIAQLLHVSWTVTHLADLDVITRDLHLRTRQIYDRLSMIPPDSHCAPTQVTQARSSARDHLWDPPFAWDDEMIDDPTAKPATWSATIDRRRDQHIDDIAVLRRAQGDKQVRLTVREAAEVIALCRTWHMTERQIELRTGLKPSRYITELPQPRAATSSARAA